MGRVNHCVRAIATQRVIWTTHLLIELPLLEDILQCYVELAQVVLAKPIMVPTETFQQRYPDHGHFK